MEQSCWDHNPAVSLSNHFSVDMSSLYFNALLKTVHPSKSHFSDLQWFNSGPCCSDVQVDETPLWCCLWPDVKQVLKQWHSISPQCRLTFTPVIWAWLLKSTTLTLDLHFSLNIVMVLGQVYVTLWGWDSTFGSWFLCLIFIFCYPAFRFLSPYVSSVITVQSVSSPCLFASVSPICSSVRSLFLCSHSQFLVLPVLSVPRPACIIFCSASPVSSVWLCSPVFPRCFLSALTPSCVHTVCISSCSFSRCPSSLHECSVWLHMCYNVYQQP